MPSFPTLGPLTHFRLKGTSGLFIGDSHEEVAHLVALRINMHNLADKGVKVLFLEYFFQQQTKISIRSATHIYQHLVARNFLHNDEMPRNIEDLLAEANDYAIDVWGLDVPSADPRSSPEANKGFAKIAWRTSKALNTLWANWVTEVMRKSYANRNFAIFAGARHGPILTKCGLNGMLLYQWLTRNVEYVDLK